VYSVQKSNVILKMERNNEKNVKAITTKYNCGS
jgi:hypothetical protein